MRAISSTLLILGLSVVVAPSLRASIAFDGTNAGSQTTVGNSLSFSGVGLTVTAYAFSTTGNSSTTLAQAALGEYHSSTTPLGLGVCNSKEIVGTCLTSGPPEHAVSNEMDTGVSPNVQNFDFVLLQFSVPVTSISLTLSPFGTTEDMDATYFSGLCTGTCVPTGNFLTNILGKTDTLAGLQSITGVTGVSTNGYSSPTSNQLQTFSLTTSGAVNWVLIGASTTSNYGGDGVADFFKLNSMTYTTTPEPATFGLAGAALAAIGLLRRKKRSATV